MQNSEDLHTKIQVISHNFKMIHLWLNSAVQNHSQMVDLKHRKKLIQENRLPPNAIKQQQQLALANDYPQKQRQNFHELANLYVNELTKQISMYMRKLIRDMNKTKIMLTPLFKRHHGINFFEENFMRFENQCHGIKYLFIDIKKDVFLHIEIYRKSNGYKSQGKALERLENAFIYELQQKYQKVQVMMTTEILEKEAKAYLEEITEIFGGINCSACGKYMALNPQLMIFMPPTVRDFGRETKQRKYYHQTCL